ncbi:S10 family peptidase [Acidicapsa dinghuensis]|uniref:S10 family peptidase n=1 Tax=Acidicapsa dinghuensis TaxID=2218256 RepID=A0ABW1EI21_9BACT|nr:peptidase S10 [Acidicapsa dinghuensis]
MYRIGMLKNLCCAPSSIALRAAVLLACVSLPALTISANAQNDKPAAEKSEKEKSDQAAKPGEKMPPLPADAHTEQTAQVNGKTLKYTVTVGTLPVYDKDGKESGQVVFTSYVVDGPNRPVTFAFNGGPGASSVYLNFGAIGPKVLNVGNEGDSPSDPAMLHDNPGTWLDFTDLVFIDPIGTGFSRSLVSMDETKKQFYSTEPDIEYLSRVVYDWLVKNNRLSSRKYLVGESYGGFRGPRITYFLQSQLGVAMNGVVLVSPYLNPTIDQNGDLSPIPWMVTLPSITAANLERQHKLTPEAMKDVLAYTFGEYATDLLKGNNDPEATPRLIRKVTEMTGLDPEFVKYSGGRLETGAYLREAHREQGKLGSVYDSNVTAFDPFPFSPDQRANDPILASIIAPTTTAMVNFVTQTVGWKVDARYNALSYEVNNEWNRDQELRSGSTEQLREAVAADPKLRVLIVHGWNDLSCPFMGSILTVNQMPIMGDPSRVAVKEYPGGHMFYTRQSSREALHSDVQAMFAAH